ncbi:nucleoside triphosphate pyrophosphohydrolase [Streptomyces atriruber]|uniref:nucleoside triphosphate pyrophosphohydrolase n=1 Tax=Streptomyces atriruber TaxID=545121 RepID=UPI0006E3ECE6|nr:nucleoside triphosphate pyrophosphohydrolase [Streptomyces atriruber]
MDDEKLVRDLIPAIAPERRYRTADASEMPALLRAKLLEEAGEVARACTEGEIAEELADVMDVVQALAALCGVSPVHLEAMRRRKQRTRGGFGHRVVLLDQIGEGDQ